MIVRRMLEWGELPIAEADDAAGVTRMQAERLLVTCGHAAARLGAAKDGSRILSRTANSLRAGQVVGVVSAGDVCVEILPKIDGLDGGKTRENLVLMLLRALDLPIADGEMTRLGFQHTDILEIVIALFCQRLFRAVHGGLTRRYLAFMDDLPALRGRLDVQRQFTINAASPQRISSRYEELSSDVPLNQVIKAAVVALRCIAKTDRNQRFLYELDMAFSDVSSVPPVRALSLSVHLDRTNAAWKGPLELARLLLLRMFQGTGVGTNTGFSLLFEMNTLFEMFIGRCFERVCRSAGQRVTLQGPQGFALTDSAGKGRFATYPDIAVRSGAAVTQIVDTKWKRLASVLDDPKQGVSQADVYQMMAYGQVYNCGNLVLLYPHHAGLGSRSGTLHTFDLPGGARRLFIATIDLADLDTVERQIAEMFSPRSDGDFQAVA